VGSPAINLFAMALIKRLDLNQLHLKLLKKRALFFASANTQIRLPFVMVITKIYKLIPFSKKRWRTLIEIKISLKLLFLHVAPVGTTQRTGFSVPLWFDFPLPVSPNTARLRFFDENYKEEDAINRRLYNNHCFVLTTIYRFSYPNRTVLL
jgi:hypothetical protein